ncbi:hypothetical protein STEG23_035913, partial [Scotinomys teguina]
QTVRKEFKISEKMEVSWSYAIKPRVCSLTLRTLMNQPITEPSFKLQSQGKKKSHYRHTYAWEQITKDSSFRCPGVSCPAQDRILL